MYDVGAHKSARKPLEKSIVLLEKQHPPPQFLGRAYWTLASTYVFANDADNTEKYFEKAIVHLPCLKWEHARCLSGLVKVYLETNKPDEAAANMMLVNETYKTYLAHEYDKDVEKIDKRTIERYCKLNYQIACFYFEQKNESYLPSLNHAIAYTSRVHITPENQSWILPLLKMHAHALIEQEKLEEAEIYLQKSLDFMDADGIEYYCKLQSLGIVCAKQKKYEEALSHYLKVLAFFKHKNDLVRQANVYNSISYLYYRRNLPKKSLEYALKALEHLSAVKKSGLKAAILDTAAAAYQLNGDYQNAEKYIRAAIEIGGEKTTYVKRLEEILESRS